MVLELDEELSNTVFLIPSASTVSIEFAEPSQKQNLNFY